MATTIQIKRSATGTSAPTLAYGELAYSFEGNTNKLWIGPSSGSAVVVGGKYYTDLFPATLGTNEASKLVSADASGNLDFSAKNLTNVSTFEGVSGRFGDATNNVTITNSSSTVTIDGAASTNIALDAYNGGTNSGNLIFKGALTLAGDASDTVKDEDDMTSDSATHLATQQSIKAYVDSTAGAVTKISAGNSCVQVTDAGTGSISSIVDTNETLSVAAAAATFKADNLDVTLKSTDSGTADGSSDTTITHRETGGVALARITGAHDQAANDKRGKLIFQTQPLTGTPADGTLQNVMTLDSNKKVTIHGDLQVDGTQTQLNTTTYTVDDPTLVLGGDFGTITGFSSSHSGTNWTNNSETIVTATGGKGTNAKFKVVVSGSTHTVTLEEGGIGFENSDSLTLAGVGGGDDITVTVTGVTTSPATDDDKERGIAFHYHNGSATKMGFFGLLGADGANKNKFTFIPDATQNNNTFTGTAGTIVATTFEGALTGNVTGNVSGTAATVTGGTQASITTAANLTTVGALTTGSIAATSNFAIDTLAGNITTGGKLIIDVDGAAGAAGSLSFGATGGAADAELYFDGTDFNITTGGDLKLTADSLNVTPDASAAVGQAITLFHDANNSDPKMQIGTGTAELIEITTDIGTSDKLLDSARINTKTASTTANDGKLLFAVDDKDIFHIGDNGLYGKEATDGYSWDPGTGSSEDYDFPQLDGFIINGGMYS